MPLVQISGGLEHRFRTIDDILEEATSGLFPSNCPDENPTPPNNASQENAQAMPTDIIYLSSISCVRSAFDRACVTKG